MLAFVGVYSGVRVWRVYVGGYVCRTVVDTRMFSSMAFLL